MRAAAREMATTETWGPVRPGFSVALPNGDVGRLQEIRVSDGTVELMVEDGASGSVVAVDGADVEAILPRRRQLVVGPPRSDDAAGVEAAGGIIRMPARHSSPVGGHTGEAA